MDDDTQQLIAIQQELERISDRLRKIFPQTLFTKVNTSAKLRGFNARRNGMNASIRSNIRYAEFRNKTGLMSSLKTFVG
jgi:hypothetical protein